MNKSTIWAWAIKNSICIICWVVLAIIFNKWWIALIGILFMSDIKQNHNYYRTCDKCGKHGPYTDSHNEALEKAKEAGWVHCVENNKDYCPECRKNIGDENI